MRLTLAAGHEPVIIECQPRSYCHETGHARRRACRFSARPNHTDAILFSYYYYNVIIKSNRDCRALSQEEDPARNGVKQTLVRKGLYTQNCAEFGDLGT